MYPNTHSPASMFRPMRVLCNGVEAFDLQDFVAVIRRSHRLFRPNASQRTQSRDGAAYTESRPVAPEWSDPHRR